MPSPAPMGLPEMQVRFPHKCSAFPVHLKDLPGTQTSLGLSVQNFYVPQRIRSQSKKGNQLTVDLISTLNTEQLDCLLVCLLVLDNSGQREQIRLWNDNCPWKIPTGSQVWQYACHPSTLKVRQEDGKSQGSLKNQS